MTNTYSYDDNNRLEKLNLSNGIEKLITYDELDRVKRIEYKDKYIISLTFPLLKLNVNMKVIYFYFL